MLDSSKLKDFADHNFKLYENGRKLLWKLQVTGSYKTEICMLGKSYTLPNDNFRFMFKLKAFCRRQIECASVDRMCFSNEENSVKRGKILVSSISPFPTMFSRGFFRILKLITVW